jgi:hypothetical protein
MYESGKIIPDETIPGVRVKKCCIPGTTKMQL